LGLLGVEAASEFFALAGNSKETGAGFCGSWVKTVYVNRSATMDEATPILLSRLHICENAYVGILAPGIANAMGDFVDAAAITARSRFQFRWIALTGRCTTR
jgi:hypothetical protein